MLPQKPYIPSGPFRRAVAYPKPADSWTADEIQSALDKVGLGHLGEEIEDEAPWDHTLSGGEKQRLAFARLLLNDPDIIVLDEATSALDEKTQDKIMQMMIDEPPNATVLSVAHRVELEAFHSRKITLEKREGGARLVSEVDPTPSRETKRPVQPSSAPRAKVTVRLSTKGHQMIDQKLESVAPYAIVPKLRINLPKFF